MPDPKLSIREVTADDDLEKVRGLMLGYQAETAVWTAECLRLQDYPAELAGLPGRYAAPTGCLLLAEVDGRPAGCLGLREIGPGLGELKRLYVIAEVRGLRLGRWLVATAVERAGGLGQTRLVLDTRPQMTAALALYRGFGFVAIPPYGDHLVEGNVYLGRDLGDGNSPTPTPLDPTPGSR